MSEPTSSSKAAQVTRLTTDKPSESASQNLEVGKVYMGTVTAVDAVNGLCDVLTKHPGSLIKEVHWATGGIMAPLVGFKIRQVPPLGAKVAVVYGSVSFVVQVFPVEESRSKSGHKKSASGQSYRINKAPDIYGAAVMGGPIPDADMLEGEFDLTNAMNVGLLFLNNIMSLKAGERAKIETHLLNDMVRVISEVYRHHSSFGDFEIYNDGKLNVEWHGTSYEHESYNTDNAKKPKVPTKNKEVDYDAVEDLPLYKQRFSQYLGHLGNFMTLFIREPQATFNSIITGKARLHVSGTGAVHVMSVDEIILEKVCRVVVPRRKKEYDDPEGDNYPEVLSGLETSPLKEWDLNQTTVHHIAHQMREYARYVSSTKPLARFKQQSKDFDIPNEEDVLPPDLLNGEEDRVKENGTALFYETYSTIRIFRNGGILMQSGDGGSFLLNNGQAWLSSPSKLTLEAAGDIVMYAGNSIYAMAHKDVHITSVTGGIMQKARKKFYMLVEDGLMWLKSDSKDKNKSLFIDAAEGAMVINAKKDLVVRSEEENLTLRSKAKNVIIRSAKDLIASIRGATLWKSRGILLYANGGRSVEIKGSKVAINKAVEVSATRLHTTGSLIVQKRLMVNQGIYGPQVLRKKHVNHIRVLGRPIPPPPTSATTLFDSLQASSVEALSGAEAEAALDSSQWKYEPTDFPSQPADGTGAAQYRSPTQDYLFSITETELDYDVWDFNDNKLLPATRTSQSLPYPGQRGKEEMIHPDSSGEALQKPSKKSPWPSTQTPLEAKEIKKKKLAQ